MTSIHTHTSTPPSAHSYTRPQHTRRASAVTDTPTPSSHNSIPPSSSIRPMATHSTLKDLGAAALKRRATLTSNASQGGLRAASPNTLNRDRPSSRLSKSSLFDSELEAIAEPIQRDNTELDRINKENSIQRIIGDLQNDRISSSDSSSAASRSSARELEQERRRDFADEDSDGGRASTASSRSRSSLSSFRIGMAGGQRVDPLEPLDAPSEDDITYVTLPRSVDSPAASPYKSPAPPPPRQNGGLFGSPRPFTTAAAPVSSPLRPSNRYADENAPPLAAPAPSSAAASNFRRSPFATQQASYPTVPARSNPPPTFLRSPAVAPVTQQQPTSRPSPLNPQINSPILGGSPTATYSRSGSGFGHRGTNSFSSGGGGGGAGVRSARPAQQHSVVYEDNEADRTTFSNATNGYRLPNATVLTEALGSPQKMKSSRRTPPARSGSSGSAKTGSTGEANLVNSAFTSLASRLALLEQQNAASSARVIELEAASSAASRPAQQTQSERDEVVRLRQEIDRHLQAEREQRAELEKVVASLRAQNTHLDKVLSQQYSDLESLRRERATASAASPPRAVAFQPAEELRTEVHDLKTGLEVLGYEVDGVRTVVEELLRDKEEREAGRKWEAEEEERRREFASRQQLEVEEDEEDVDRTPRPKRTQPVQQQQQRKGAGTFEAPGTPSERSFVSAAEISRLQAEQDLETSRRTPRTSRHRHQHISDLPPRPSSAPLHRSRPTAAANARSTLSYSEEDASYLASSATFDGESVSYSQSSGEQTYVEDADEEDASTLYDEPETLPPLPASRAPHKETKRGVRVVVEDEPDFARAEEIFADVSRATEHSPRRKSTRSQSQQQRKKVDRVVLVEEPSINLCSNCHGRKSSLKPHVHAQAAPKEKEKKRSAREEQEKVAEKQRRKVMEEKEVRRKVEREREEHRRTLEGVLERLESEFGVQKKIYLELTTEYQSMSTRHETSKRRALASHLKQSIDVLEDKARDVKQYADALANLYDALPHSCPSTTGRKRHAVV